MERKFHLFWAGMVDSGFPPGRGIVRFYAAFEAGDSDGDGLNDAFETLALGTSTNSPDSDGDGVSDATEYAAGIDPVVKGAPVCDALGCRKGAPFSIEDAAAIANPRFNEGWGFQNNCQRCVQAYELARRGYDVEANARPRKGYNPIIWGSELFREKDGSLARLRLRMSEADVRSAIAGTQGNARFVVYVSWKNSKKAHVFIAEKTPGGIRFIDPQTNGLDVSGYFAKGKHGEFGLLRVDDLQLNVTKTTLGKNNKTAIAHKG